MEAPNLCKTLMIDQGRGALGGGRGDGNEDVPRGVAVTTAPAMRLAEIGAPTPASQTTPIGPHRRRKPRELASCFDDRPFRSHADKTTSNLVDLFTIR